MYQLIKFFNFFLKIFMLNFKITFHNNFITKRWWNKSQSTDVKNINRLISFAVDSFRCLQKYFIETVSLHGHILEGIGILCTTCITVILDGRVFIIINL